MDSNLGALCWIDLEKPAEKRKKTALRECRG
jgi:hypothetical protein